LPYPAVARRGEDGGPDNIPRLPERTLVLRTPENRSDVDDLIDSPNTDPDQTADAAAHRTAALS